MRFVIGFIQALCFSFVLGSVFSPSSANADPAGSYWEWAGTQNADHVPVCNAAISSNGFYDDSPYLKGFYKIPFNSSLGSSTISALGKCVAQYWCCGVPVRVETIYLHCPPGQVTFFFGIAGCDEYTREREFGRQLCNAIGNPIIMPYGNKHQRVTDFTTSGPNSLEFTRFYSSRHGAPGGMGLGWTHSFEFRLRADTASKMDDAPETIASIEAYRPTGEVITFTRTSGTIFQSSSDISLTLERVGTQWEVKDTNGTVELYNTWGYLQSLTETSGYQIIATHSLGNLTNITDSYGRSIEFIYEGFDRVSSVKAPDGKIYNYEYGAFVGPLAKVVFNISEETSNPLYSYPVESEAITYHYEDTRFPTALTGITDQKGVRFATWEYDDQVRATRSVHAGNAEDTHVVYDDVNKVVTATNSLGKQTKYHYDEIVGVNKITRVEGLSSTNCLPSDSYITYDANGFISSSTDRNGNITNFTRNNRGLPEVIVEAVGLPEEHTVTATWHANLNTPTQIVIPGLTVDLTYDVAGNLTSTLATDTTSHTVPYSTQGETRTATYTYSNTGQLLTVDGPLAGSADLTTYDYNLEGYLSKVTNALGHVTEITSQDANGRPLVALSINGEETRYVYDNLGRLFSTEVGPVGSASITFFEYDSRNLISRIIWPDGSEESYLYNDARYLIEVSRPTGEKIINSYDAMGNKISVEVRDGSGVLKNNYTQNFDELGRLIKLIGANTQETNLAYDKNDNVVSVTDPRSKITQNSFDGLNRLVSETNALNDQATVSYNTAGDLDGFTDQRSNTTSYVHNGFGDVIQRISPDSGTTTYVYDVAGRLTAKTDARGVEVNYAYDLLDRVTTRSYPSTANETVTFTYDDILAGNKGLGRLTSVTDQAGAVAYSYGTRGNLLSEIRVIGSNTYVTTYGYDISDNLISITYPSGRIVSYQRDNQGRVESVSTQKNALSAPQVLAAGLRYEAYGPLAAFRQGNGMETSLSYDGDYRLTGISTQKNGTSLHSLTFAYDAAGNVTSETDAQDNALSQIYGYDDINRLTSASGIYGANVYSYDAVGNMLSRTRDSGGTLLTDTLSYSPTSNRLQSASISDGTQTLESSSYTYEANGNTERQDPAATGRRYEYNQANNLAAVILENAGAADIWSYRTYDAYNRRLIKQVHQTDQTVAQDIITHFHYGPGDLMLAESDKTGATIREYIYLGAIPLAVIEGSTAITGGGEVILDNGDSGTTATGDWVTEIAGSGYEGSNYLYRANGDGTNSYSWTPTLGASDQYQVYVKWPDLPADKSSTATYQVIHAGGTTDTTVDQRQDGGEWAYLGLYSMDSAVGHGVSLLDTTQEYASYDEIIDNDHPQVTISGAWGKGFNTIGGTYWGQDYVYQEVFNNVDTFSWPLPIPEKGRYKIFTRWKARSTYSAAAEYQVDHDGGQTVVTFDQTKNPSQWYTLGSFDLTPDQAPRVTLKNGATTGLVLGDAIRIVRDSSSVGLDEIIIDNSDPEFTTTGTWTASSKAGGYEGTNYLYLRSSDTSLGATWAPNLIEAGNYKVSVKYQSGSSNNTDAKYTVTHDNGSTTFGFNQKISNSLWQPLGTFALQPWQSHGVTLNASNNQYVIADAVKFERTSNPITYNGVEVIVDNTDPEFTTTGSWATSNNSAGYTGTNYRHLKTVDTTLGATWTPNLPIAATYQVYVKFTTNTTHHPAAEYTITHQNGTSVVTVDQTVSANKWKWMLLGEFPLQPGLGQGVTLRGGDNKYVIADAVRFVIPDTSGSDFVLDNTSAGSFATGTWITRTGLGGGRYWGTEFVRQDLANISATDLFTWTPSLSKQGRYRLYARWASDVSYAGAAEYTVHHANGNDTVVHNQQAMGGTWMSLGTYDFIPGQNNRIELSNSDLTKTAAADAIRFEWVGDSKSVTADAARFVQNDAQEVSYILWDNLFTPKKLVDSSGTVVWDAALKPYGGEESILGSAVMNLRMPGQYVDEETGRGSGSSLTHPLFYNYNRDYDPAIGRYVQVDPIGLAGGGNPYRYANASPTNYIDPDGKIPIPVIVGVISGGYSLIQMACSDEFSLGKLIFDSALGYAGGGVASALLKKFGAPALGILGGLAKPLKDLGEKLWKNGRKKGSAGVDRTGKDFTPKTKRELDAENSDKYGGKNKCENCGVELVPGKKSERGVTPPGNERQRDHIIPKSKGGDGTVENGELLCRICNLGKGDKT